MGKILMIVDCQNDFVNGSLAVDGADKVIDKMVEYINEHFGEYDACILTMDWHPSNHISFKSYGGEWPTHCVRFSNGAEIDKRIINSVKGHFEHVKIIHKGENSNEEEYSALSNEYNVKTIKSTICRFNASQIDIFGIAYDYCVFNTLKDCIEKLGTIKKIALFKSLSPSIGDGNDVDEYAKKNNKISVL